MYLLLNSRTIRNYCPVIIGGSWHFNTGRYLYWPHEPAIEVLSPTEERILLSDGDEILAFADTADKIAVTISYTSI